MGVREGSREYGFFLAGSFFNSPGRLRRADFLGESDFLARANAERAHNSDGVDEVESVRLVHRAKARILVRVAQLRLGVFSDVGELLGELHPAAAYFILN